MQEQIIDWKLIETVQVALIIFPSSIWNASIYMAQHVHCPRMQ